MWNVLFDPNTSHQVNSITLDLESMLVKIHTMLLSEDPICCLFFAWNKQHHSLQQNESHSLPSIVLPPHPPVFSPFDSLPSHFQCPTNTPIPFRTRFKRPVLRIREINHHILIQRNFGTPMLLQIPRKRLHKRRSAYSAFPTPYLACG